MRPPVPGAAIRSADFLPDGRVALAIEVPPTAERQPWAYDPASARLDRLGNAAAPGASALLPAAKRLARGVSISRRDDRLKQSQPSHRHQQPAVANRNQTGEITLGRPAPPSAHKARSTMSAPTRGRGGKRSGINLQIFLPVNGAQKKEPRSRSDRRPKFSAHARQKAPRSYNRVLNKS